ncbi:RmlC-like cupin [Mycena kentingensis (nom. inval.)]|nr:RmlC-like cupin [Mycena kentingensis (nom. inval.)]
MFARNALLVFAAVAYASAAAVLDKAQEAALVEKIRLAPTAVDQINALPDDEQFKFDFFDPKLPSTNGAGGKIVTANAGNFPAVVGRGSAMAVGFLEPCSMNTPHTHPRATEMQISLNNTIRTGMITENGARFIMTELPAGSMTVFQQGSIHFQVNDNCEPAMFVASFNSEDPGVLSVAQRFLGLPFDITAATLGEIGVEQLVGLEAQLPDSFALGTDACLKRCGLQRTKQPSAQRQPRVSGNAIPAITASGTASGSMPSATYGSDNKPRNIVIQVGANGLNFTPPYIEANVHDTVTFEFHAKNHSVTQSSFDAPCTPLHGGFDSGFKPVSVDQKSGFPTWTITVNDTQPIWGHCMQQGPPVHCTEGMVFAINPSKEKTFEAFQAAARALKGKKYSVVT